MKVSPGKIWACFRNCIIHRKKILVYVMVLSLMYYVLQFKQFRYSQWYRFDVQARVRTLEARRTCAKRFFADLDDPTIAQLACDHTRPVDLCVVLMSVGGRKMSISGGRDNETYFLPAFYSVARLALQEGRVCAFVLNGNGEQHNRADTAELQMLPPAWLRHSPQTKGGQFLRENHDYATALDMCARYAPHVLEDDTQAGTGCISTSLELLPKLQTSSYIKLFFPDFYEGWSNWNIIPVVLGIVAAGAAVVLLYLVRWGRSRSSRSGSWLWFFGAIFCLTWPVVVFCVLVGRQSVVGPWITGLVPARASNTQALLFLSSRTDQASAFLRNSTLATDIALAAWVDSSQAPAWQWRPSLFQHVGLRTSLPGKAKELSRSNNKDMYSTWFKEDSNFQADDSETLC